MGRLAFLLFFFTSKRKLAQEKKESKTSPLRKLCPIGLWRGSSHAKNADCRSKEQPYVRRHHRFERSVKMLYFRNSGVYLLCFPVTSCRCRYQYTNYTYICICMVIPSQEQKARSQLGRPSQAVNFTSSCRCSSADVAVSFCRSLRQRSIGRLNDAPESRGV